VTLLRLRGLRDSSAILATLKILIDIVNDIDIGLINRVFNPVANEFVCCMKCHVRKITSDI